MEKCAEVYGMTNVEKAIIMAYTGTCMLTGDKFNIFLEYVEKLMGRPVYTHELGFLADEIKEKAKDDFIELCKADAELENTPSVMFQTPQGRQVKYIKCEVLDKIRAEIAEIQLIGYATVDGKREIASRAVMQIIDKYIAESEEV